MSLHTNIRPALMEHNVVGKLIDVLRDANLEDLELAKVGAKAIHNLQGIDKVSSFWSEDNVKKLDIVTL